MNPWAWFLFMLGSNLTSMSQDSPHDRKKGVKFFNSTLQFAFRLAFSLQFIFHLLKLHLVCQSGWLQHKKIKLLKCERLLDRKHLRAYLRASAPSLLVERQSPPGLWLHPSLLLAERRSGRQPGRRQVQTRLHLQSGRNTTKTKLQLRCLSCFADPSPCRQSKEHQCPCAGPQP